MNNKSNNFFNENSFTFDLSVTTNEFMSEVADYVRSRVAAAKSGYGQPVVPAPAPAPIPAAPTPQSSAISAADELIKFKELLDMGILTQEEFDAKKKQLLGL